MLRPSVPRTVGGGSDGDGGPSLARALRDVQNNVKVVAESLRERRRDIERAAKAWEGEKARVAAEAGVAAALGNPSGMDGSNSADAAKAAAARASDELNARAAKAASKLPGLAQIGDAVAAADAERRRSSSIAVLDDGDDIGSSAAADKRTQSGVGGGGMRAATVSARVASEEFPPGVAERLVSRGASFDAALKSSENDAAGPRKMIGTGRRRRGEGRTESPDTRAQTVGGSVGVREASRARVFERTRGPQVRRGPPGGVARLGVAGKLQSDILREG